MKDEDEVMRWTLLMSEQEDTYGKHMFEMLDDVRDHRSVQTLVVGDSMPFADAVLKVFQRKFGENIVVPPPINHVTYVPGIGSGATSNATSSSANSNNHSASNITVDSSVVRSNNSSNNNITVEAHGTSMNALPRVDSAVTSMSSQLQQPSPSQHSLMQSQHYPSSHSLQDVTATTLPLPMLSTNSSFSMNSIPSVNLQSMGSNQNLHMLTNSVGQVDPMMMNMMAANASQSTLQQQQQQATVNSQASVGRTMQTMNEVHERLQERGEKLSRMSHRTEEMANQANEFARLAKMLNEQQKSRWF